MKILVHGDANEMGRLRSALQSKYAEKEHPMQIYTPKNCETIELHFKGKKQAKVIGEMAKVEPKNNDRLSGVLVSKDFHYHIMDAKELSEFTDVNTTEIIQKQKLSFHGTFSLVIFHLEQMFGEIKIIDNESILVFNTVTVKSIGKSQLQVEWKSDNTGDMIADSVLAVLLQIEGSPASVRMTESISLQKKKKVDEEKEFQRKSKDSILENDSNENDKNNFEKDISMDSTKEENIEKEKPNKKTEVVDAMDIDDTNLAEDEDKLEKNKDNKMDLKIPEDKEESLSDSVRKVMFHNIMDNSHIPLEEDMEFELYMYKFLCMQFGVENVTSENMSLPIMLDYFGSNDGVTYNIYDNETSKLTIKVDKNDNKKRKEDKSVKLDTKSNNSGKKMWKVHIDNHSCTIDRKTLEINSTNDALRKRVLNVVSRVKKILRPLSETWNDLLNNTESEVSEEEEEEQKQLEKDDDVDDDEDKDN